MTSLAHSRSDAQFSDPAEAPPVEAELVHETLAGDGQAFGELVRLHSRRVFNFLNQMTRQPQDAEDLAQQTFIKAYKNLHRFDTSRPLAGWLLTIARRTALNHFRGAKQWDELPDEVPADDPTPATLAEEHEEVDDIWTQAKRQLSEKEYRVMWLRYGENLSIKETARVAGLTQTHVKILVFRARRRLLPRGTPS
jgi:RNA polymerase sigma-70 factor (ECF subfamily)